MWNFILQKKTDVDIESENSSIQNDKNIVIPKAALHEILSLSMLSPKP